jgi:hypothetical protein
MVVMGGRRLFGFGWGATVLGVVMAVGAVWLGRLPRHLLAPAPPATVAPAPRPRIVEPVPAPIQSLWYEFRVLSPRADADAARVFSSNERMLQVCFDRALLRGMLFADGRFGVRLTLGKSGRVVRVGLAGSPRERHAIEPCAREVVSRWVFPQRRQPYSAALELDVHVR